MSWREGLTQSTSLCLLRPCSLPPKGTTREPTQRWTNRSFLPCSVLQRVIWRASAGFLAFCSWGAFRRRAEEERRGVRAFIPPASSLTGSFWLAQSLLSRQYVNRTPSGNWESLVPYIPSGHSSTQTFVKHHPSKASVPPGTVNDRAPLSHWKDRTHRCLISQYAAWVPALCPDIVQGCGDLVILHSPCPQKASWTRQKERGARYSQRIAKNAQSALGAESGQCQSEPCHVL